MRSILILALAIGGLFCLPSCKKQAGPAGPTGPNGPQGIAGPALTGSLKGFVNHFDISGAKLTTGLTGDSVLIDGTNKVSVTDAAGTYSFGGLNTGVYNLTVKRAGFGTTKLQSVQFTGGGDLYRNFNLGAIPTNSVGSFTAKDTTINSINYIRLKGTISSTSNVQSVVVFVGSPSSTVVSAAASDQISYYTLSINPGITTFAKNIPTQDFYDLGYASGNTAYFAAYTINGNTNASSYQDEISNKTIFTAIGSMSLTSNAPVQ